MHSRRQFLTTSLGAASLGAATAALPRMAHAAGDDTVKIALVGCGGRGTGAAANALANTSHRNVKLVAMADAFEGRLQASHKTLTGRHPDQVDVPPERRFVGLDAYKKLLATDCDLVLLCGPPGFRPLHFEAAVDAGKHIFAEKPLATDAPGFRRILAANEKAKQKERLVAVGHHLRHEKKHTELIDRIHNGAIGDLHTLRVYFNSGGVWVRPRSDDETEMEFQVKNWYYFTWLSGDHIVEQHVHDIDVGLWIAQAHPIEAVGMGGRQVRVGDPNYGEIFDHHAVEYTFADGTKMFSYCRHQRNTWSSFSEHAHGTKGRADMQGHGTTELLVDGADPVKWRREADGHQTEHDHLFAALIENRPYNEVDLTANSTMAAILGRMATYTGQRITWDEAVASSKDLFPERLAWDAPPKPQPGPDGTYPCAIPGVTTIEP